MEFDIINEIMTDTISNFFQPVFSTPTLIASQNEPLGLSNQQLKNQPITSISPNSFKVECNNNHFFVTLLAKKTFSEPQKLDTRVSSDYPSIESTQSLQKLTEITTSSRLKKESVNVVNANSPLTSTFLSQELSQNQLSKDTTPYTIERWITKDGPQKLNESLSKLNLNINNIGKISLSGLSAKQLETEKKNVKHELKRYDAAFSDIFKRMPTREEKEAMRPLYIYYKRLKQYLTKAEKEEKTVNSEGSKPQSLGNVSIDSEKNSRITPQKHSDLIKERENKATVSYGNLSGKRMESSFEEQLLKDNVNVKASSLKNIGEKPNVMKNQEKRMSREEAQKKLEILDAVKSQMREKLHAYQVEFMKNNNRKIKYHKDIVPVEDEYKRYKEVKDEIASLEEILKS